MKTDRSPITIKCSRGHGSIEIPSNLTADEFQKLKLKAANIWGRCQDSGVGYLCKCEIADLIRGDLDKQSESDSS